MFTGFPKKSTSSANMFPRSGSSIPGMSTPGTTDSRQRGSTASTSDNQQGSATMFGGGLSVTGCLADFSLYIFHPYGGGQRKQTLANLESSFYRKDLGRHMCDCVSMLYVYNIVYLEN